MTKAMPAKASNRGHIAPRCSFHIHPENGQGMGIPERCVVWRCRGAIVKGKRFYECSSCGVPYGND